MWLYSPAYEIVTQLSKLPCVTEVNRVDGPYDIIVKLSDDNTDMIKESIGKHMTRISGIESTLTLMAEWLLILLQWFVSLFASILCSLILLLSRCRSWVK